MPVLDDQHDVVDTGTDSDEVRRLVHSQVVLLVVFKQTLNTTESDHD